MSRPRTAWKTLSLLALFALSGTLANAQAVRTWVSGVGDDANPCSRTAPCKTFAGAISKTAAGGEINVLDPGGFGAVTITKSISIVNDGVGSAGISASGTNGIIVNAAAADVIVIRGLDIEGFGNGINGIRHIAGGSLSVENCTINNFTQKAIDYEPNGPSQLSVRNTIIRNNVNGANAGGILIKPTAAGFTLVSIDGVTLSRNNFGIRAEDNSKVTITRSTIAGSTQDGIISFSNSIPTAVTVTDTVSVNNGAGGIRSEGMNSTVRLTRATVTGNNTALVKVASGAIVSYSSNVFDGNAVASTPSSTLPSQ
jgi:hypothetical protein